MALGSLAATGNRFGQTSPTTGTTVPGFNTTQGFGAPGPANTASDPLSPFRGPSTPRPPSYTPNFGTAYGQVASTGTDWKSIFDILDSQNAVARAQQEALSGAKAGLFDSRETGLRNDYNLGMRGLDLDQQGIGIDRGAAQRDQAYYTNLLALLPQYRGLSKDELDATLRSAAQQGNMERIGINSEYTGRGAFLTPMRGVKNYNSLLSQANAEDKANIGYQRDMLGLTEKELGLTRSRDMSGDTLKKLDLESARLGISREKLQNTLEQGLAQLGYNRYVNLNTLLNGVDGQNAEAYLKILQQAYQIGMGLDSGGIGNAMNGYGG